ncbi:MAG: hypothetical protein HDR21_07165 [Lachnospiraceae bacterium]|nr:hypothetical protein [Lachnospiraceae bacterium]
MNSNVLYKKIRLVILVLALILVVMTVEYWFLVGKQKNGEQTTGNVDYQKISVRYGDTIEQIPVRQAGGQEVVTLPYGQPVTLVVYLSEACKTCVDSLAEYERISGILGQENISYLFLFSDRIPASIAERYGVPLEQCYTVDDSVELALSTPTWIYLNSDGRIEMVNSDDELVLEKILKSGYVSSEQLQENARNYLTGHYADADDGRPVLFYFSMQGCMDCAAADEMIAEQKLEEQFEIIRVYTDESDDQGLITDRMQLFRRVFDINWYPSFLLVREGHAELIVEYSLEALQESLLREAGVSGSEDVTVR